MSYKISFAVIGAALLAACTTSEPTVVNMTTALNATQEVPPTTSPATGQGVLNFDRESRQLSWNIEYAGLTAPLQAAHFHGPAAPGANAGVLVPIPVGPSPLKGAATLTAAQTEILMGGRMYVNLHTATNPGGEIRGQVSAPVVAPPPVTSSGPTQPYYAPAPPPNVGAPTIHRY